MPNLAEVAQDPNTDWKRTKIANWYGAAGAFWQAAWYQRRDPTFSDALAMVSKELWAQEERTFYGSRTETDTVRVPRAFVDRLTDAVCYAA